MCTEERWWAAFIQNLFFIQRFEQQSDFHESGLKSFTKSRVYVELLYFLSDKFIKSQVIAALLTL